MKCQSCTWPSMAWYWHIGETTMRLRSSQLRIRNGVNRSGMVIEAFGAATLLRGGPWLFDLVDHAVEIANHFHHFGQSLLALAAEFPEGGERRANVADRITLSRRERLGIALMAVGRVSFLDDRVDAVDQPLDALGIFEAAFGTEVANPRRRTRDVIAIGIDITDCAIEVGFDDALAGEHVHHAMRLLDDVVDARHVLARLLDVADPLESMGEPCHQFGRHVDIGGEGIVVEHDGYGDPVADRPVIGEDLVIGRSVVIGRDDHETVGAELLGLDTVAYRVRRIGIHGADQHRHALADMLDGLFHEKRAFVIADRQKLARCPENDQPRNAFGKLPIDEALPCRNIDTAAVRGERGDCYGETAAERLGHLAVSEAIDRAFRMQLAYKKISPQKGAGKVEDPGAAWLLCEPKFWSSAAGLRVAPLPIS